MEKRRMLSASRSAGLLLVALAWALFLCLTGSPEAILFTVPVFLLAAPLALGRYVGEETLARLRGGIRRRVARAVDFRFTDVLQLRAGLLEAGRMPARGPPVAAH